MTAPATERDRRDATLIAAYQHLYDVCWNKIGTVESEVDGYNLLSYGDCAAVEDACLAIERLEAQS